MIDPDVLKKFGSTPERLKEILTAQAKPEDADLDEEKKRAKNRDIEERRKLQDRVRNRIYEGITFGLRNAQFFQSADAAWDSSILMKQVLPLVMYAQGYVKFESIKKQFSKDPNLKQFVGKDDKGQETVNIPRFVDCTINLVRSFVARRAAAQTNNYARNYPYYKFDPRRKDMLSQLRAAILSEKADIIADQWGHRECDEQIIRDQLLYGYQVALPRKPWEVVYRYDQVLSEDVEDDDPVVESTVEKEGVYFQSVHPSRFFYDTAHPISTLNTDTGCNFFGEWDIIRYRDILDDEDLFNQDRISYSGTLWGLHTTYNSYFAQCWSDTITPPPSASGTDPITGNDRRAWIGVYSSLAANTASTNGLAEAGKDAAIFRSHYYERICPKEIGWGTYPGYVWVRFKVVSDDTIVGFDVFPTCPAAVCQHNQKDDRFLSPSFAHDVMTFQDQLTNTWRAMLHQLEIDLTKVFLLNQDLIPAAERSKVEQKLKAKGWYADGPVVIPLSFSEMQDMGYDIRSAMQLIEANVSDTINNCLRASASIMRTAEEMVNMSPAERGQVAPHEITAAEVTQVAQTTTTIQDNISIGIDRYMGAKKRIIYESLMCLSKGKFQVPVVQRFPREVIEAAGFQVVDDDQYTPERRRSFTVTGTVKALRYEYNYTSRDGGTRASDSVAANSLVQLVSALAPLPAFQQGMTKEGWFKMINEILRLLGSSMELKLEPGESGEFSGDEITALAQAVGELGQNIKQIDTDNNQQNQQIAQILQQLQATNGTGQAGRPVVPQGGVIAV